MRVLLTGCAGFIGFHLAAALLDRGHVIYGVDSFQGHYDPALKHARLARLEGRKDFSFAKIDITDSNALGSAAEQGPFEVVVHLAAQPGVRYSLEDPDAYTRSNLVGHQNILEFCKYAKRIGHLVYASSSSVYGNDTRAPFSEDARADHPVSYYGATKRACELMSHAYAESFGLKQTGLRFFTVYGPWGRPDMAYWLFTDAVLRGKPVPLYNGGRLRRDFTWIEDVISAVVRIVETPFRQEQTRAPSRIYNLGNNRPESVRTLIELIERATGKKAVVEDAAAPPGDVNETHADITRAQRDLGFSPKTPLSEGIPRFVSWFREYHRI
ncbi:MAG: NAD-dependent epimerase/dehydratase family protein [Alphaproteobacteria bacterium]